MNLISTILVAATVFGSTNIDDLFLLAAYFASPLYFRSSIVAGQFLGITALILASALAALPAFVLPEGWVAMLGIVPLGLGVHRLYRLKEELRSANVELLPLDEHTDRRARRTHQFLSVAGVTIANGGDNLGVYIPLFAHDAQAI